MNQSTKDLQIYLTCGALTLIIFGIDLLLPLGIAGGVPYVLVVLVSAWLPDRRFIFFVATLCTLLTYVGFELSPTGGEFEKVFGNRLLANFAIWVTAVLVFQRKGIEEALKTVNRDLEDRVAIRTAEIQETNARLTREMADRILAEQCEQKEKELAQHYLNVAEVIMVVISEQGEVELINKKGCALLERSEAEIIGNDWFELAIPLSMRTQIQKVFKETLTGSRQDFEYYENPIRSKSGREYVIAWHNALLHDEDGRLVKVLSSGEDITRQKETEQALRLAHDDLERRIVERTASLAEANAQLKTEITERKCVDHTLRLQSQIMDNMTESISLVSTDGVIAYTNPRFESQFGYDSGELLGQPVSILNAPSDRSPDEMARDIMRDLKQTGTWSGEVNNIRKDGVTFWCHFNVSTFNHADYGEVWLGVAEDITERKWAEQRLEKINECLLGFGSDPLVNINRLTAVCGELFGATCALYSRLEGELLCSVGQWQTPPDFNAVNRAEGHLCYDLIQRGEDGISVVRHLAETSYAKTDPNVSLYNLQTYVGQMVKTGDEAVGSLCAVFQHDVVPTEADERIMGILAAAIGTEEERMQAEKELRASEARLKEAQRIAHIGSWELDLVKNELMWSDEVFRIFEINPAEFIASYEAFLDLIHPDDRAMVDKTYTESVQTKIPYQIIHRLLMADGQIKFVEEQCKTFYDDQGHPLRSMGTIQDITERRKAEESLKRTEHMYHQILDAIPDLVFVKHPDSRLVWANRAFCDYYGMISGQIEGLIDSPLNKPEYTQQYLEADAYVFDTGRILYIPEEPITQHEGEVRFFQTIKSPIFGDHGNVAMLVGVARDMTERKNAERVLKTQAHIINQIHDAVVSTDLNGLITSWNKGAEGQYGYTAKEAIGKHISLIYPEDQQGFLLKEIIARLRAKGNHEVEAQVCRKSGERRSIHLSLGVLKDEEGNPTGIIGYSLDITEKKLTEKTLRKFEKVINCSKDLLAFVDRTLVFRAANKQYEEIFNIPQKDVVGKQFSELRGKEQFEVVWAPVLRRGLSGESLTFEHWVNFPDDIQCYMETNIDPFFENNGEISGVVVQCRNITERHEMETMKAQYLNRVLSAQEEERARIARELHDETGQALTFLMVGLRTLGSLKSVKQIKERANQLRSFTFKTLEEVQRLAVGLHPSILDDLGLRAAIKWYAGEFAERYGVNISLEKSDLGDSRLSYEIETSLYRIFQEALTNIAKHAKAKKIKVLFRHEQKLLKMIIEDDGCGFNMENQESSSIRAKRLGLHGMHERTRLLGGTLLIDSSPGHGTFVSVEIPIKAVSPT